MGVEVGAFVRFGYVFSGKDIRAFMRKVPKKKFKFEFDRDDEPTTFLSDVFLGQNIEVHDYIKESNVAEERIEDIYVVSGETGERIGDIGGDWAYLKSTAFKVTKEERARLDMAIEKAGLKEKASHRGWIFRSYLC